MKNFSSKILILSCLIIGMAFSLNAQKKEDNKGCPFNKREEILLERDRFLKEELRLAPKEFEQMSRVLKELDDKKFLLWKEVRLLHEKKIKQGLTRQEEEQLFDLRNRNKAQSRLLEEEAMQELKQYIPIEKLDKLDQARRKFAIRFAAEHHRKSNKQ